MSKDREPVYTFTKEHGWHIARHESLVFDHGTLKMEVTARLPEPGEWCVFDWDSGTSTLISDGKAILPEWAKWYNNYSYSVRVADADYINKTIIKGKEIGFKPVWVVYRVIG